MEYELKQSKVVQDESSHWYIIPAELEDDFFKDSQDESFINKGGFDEKYGEYATGGDLNLKLLYSIFPCK